MHRISVNFLRELHRYAIDSGNRDEVSLRDSVLDEGTLHCIATKAKQKTSSLERAAFLLYAIAKYHPFFEANKRTAVLAAEFVLDDQMIIVSGEELNRFVRKVASGKTKEKDVLEWLTLNCEKITY